MYGNLFSGRPSKVLPWSWLKSLGLGLGLDKKVLFTSLGFTSEINTSSATVWNGCITNPAVRGLSSDNSTLEVQLHSRLCRRSSRMVFEFSYFWYCHKRKQMNKDNLQDKTRSPGMQRACSDVPSVGWNVAVVHSSSFCRDSVCQRHVFFDVWRPRLLGCGRRRVRALSWVPSQRHSSLPRVVRPATATVRRPFQPSSETVSTLSSSVPRHLLWTGPSLSWISVHSA